MDEFKLFIFIVHYFALTLSYFAHFSMPFFFSFIPFLLFTALFELMVLSWP